MVAWNDRDVRQRQLAVPAAVDMGAWDGNVPLSQPNPVRRRPPAEQWIAAPADRSPYVDAATFTATRLGRAASHVGTVPSDVWCWQVLPEGLIYHSYRAGVHEPRLGDRRVSEHDGRVVLGRHARRPRRPVALRHATTCSFRKAGSSTSKRPPWCGSTFDEIRDFETADYRVGIPLTYGIDNWQFKFAVYHLSSHLGDEFAIAHPGSLDDRINYVRDALVLGASYYPQPFMRLYAEAGYALQHRRRRRAVGIPIRHRAFASRAPRAFTARRSWQSTPTCAKSVDFGGDINTQAGWLWRNESGQVMRIGVHYFNGKIEPVPNVQRLRTTNRLRLVVRLLV